MHALPFMWVRMSWLLTLRFLGSEVGNARTMFKLGSTYESGQWTKKDEAEAIRSYRMPQEGGIAEAANRLEYLTNHISRKLLR